jgi:hypothetical protein
MTKVFRPAAYAAVAALSLLVLDTSFFIDNARADTCVAGPSTSAPEGEHWYYRSDRATHRKCWYLHATVQLAHHAMTASADAAAEPAEAAPAPQPPAAPAEPAGAISTPPSSAPVPSPAANAPASASQADNAPSAPHVTVLTVRTVSTPFVGAGPAPAHPAPPDASAPPMAQPLPGDENAAANGVKPPGGAETPTLPPVPEAVRHELATTINAANATTQTGPAEMFFLLALALGIAAVVIVIASRIANRQQAPRLSDDPDTAWLRYRAANAQYDDEAAHAAPHDEQDVPFVDPQGQHGLADLHEQEWYDQPSSEAEDYPAARSTDGDPAPAEPAAPSLRDIQLALRVLRQARQSRVA